MFVHNGSVSLFTENNALKGLWKYMVMLAIFVNIREPFEQFFPLMLQGKFGWSWAAIFRGDIVLKWSEFMQH